jgi:serine/threonine protein kinase
LYNGPQYAPTTRLQLSFLPLAYQWALHIISGLEFIHSHEVVLGNLDLTNCWLASDPRSSLSLVGFLNAGFKYVKQWSALYAADQDQNDWKGFLPLGHYRNAPVTRQTDLFWYGCTVYELMTGSWPATQDSLMRIRECTVEELAGMFTTRGWPVLETEYMGAIVHRCWNDEYASAEEVKAAVRSFLQGLGWEVEGNDDLKGFCATDLFPQEQH